MKQSDIFSIILIATIGTLAAFFIVNSVMGDPNEKSVTFNTIDAASSSVVTPDPEVFNKEAINPTIEVYVGECEDVDQNGIIDQAELVACGKGGESSGTSDNSTGGE